MKKTINKITGYFYNNIRDIYQSKFKKKKISDWYLFFDYLTHGDIAFTGSEARSDFKSKYVSENGCILIPADVVMEFNKEVMVRADLLTELHHIVVKNDKYVQPIMVMNPTIVEGEHESDITEVIDGKGIHFVDIENPNFEWDDAYSKLYVNNSFQSVSINFDKKMSDTEIIEKAATEITDFMESTVFNGKSNSYDPSYQDIHSIFDHKNIHHISKSMNTIGGHIPFPIINRLSAQERHDATLLNALKDMYSHLPRGYKSRAKWIMHPDTADFFESIHLPIFHVEKQVRGKYVHKYMTLFGKPVITSKHMPKMDELNKYPLIFGDFSKAYVRVRSPQAHVKRTGKNKFEFTFSSGGQVMRPASIKYLKIVKESDWVKMYPIEKNTASV